MELAQVKKSLFNFDEVIPYKKLVERPKLIRTFVFGHR